MQIDQVKAQLKNLLNREDRFVIVGGIIFAFVIIIFVIVSNINDTNRREQARLNMEASKLGFSSVTEMQEIQAKGFDKKIDYEESEAKRLGFDSLTEKNDLNQKGFITKQEYLDASEAAKKAGWEDYAEKKEANSKGFDTPREYRAMLAKQERERIQAEEQARQDEARAKREKDRELYCYVYNEARQACATAADMSRCMDIKIPSWAASGRYLYSCY
jgi:hypothetical protein